jgi:hypothetical protein
MVETVPIPDNLKILIHNNDRIGENIHRPGALDVIHDSLNESQYGRVPIRETEALMVKSGDRLLAHGDQLLRHAGDIRLTD